MSDEAPDGAVTDDEPSPAVASRELARRAVTHEVLTPLDVAQQKAAMAVYQEGLKSILDASDWQGTNDKPFVKKSGWRKIAAWFNLSIEKVPGSDRVERDDDGSLLRAEVWVRATAPNGRYAEGDGYCDVSEPRFAKARARQKLENDLRGTAATRATNRAISNLVGMGAVSAEEVDAGEGTSGLPMADDALTTTMLKGLAYLLDTGDGPNEKLAVQAYNRIGKRFDGIPQAAAYGLLEAATVLKHHIDAGDTLKASPGTDAAKTPEGNDPEPEPEVLEPDHVESPPMTDEEREAEAAVQARLANEF